MRRKKESVNLKTNFHLSIIVRPQTYSLEKVESKTIRKVGGLLLNFTLRFGGSIMRLFITNMTSQITEPTLETFTIHSGVGLFANARHVYC